MSRSVLKSTGLVGALTLLSRITGLVRDMIFAQAFGAGALMDAFLVAYKIPNFMRRLFAEGAFGHSFVPVISEYRLRRTPGEVRGLVGDVAGTLGGVLLVGSLLGVIAAPLLILVFAPGFHATPDKYQLTVQMLRWTFPYLFFISLTALCSGVLNSYQRFVVPALTQVVMNLVMIAVAVGVALHSAHPGPVLAMGVFIAGVVQLLFQLPAVARLRLLGMPRWRPAAEGVRRIAKLMLPGIIGSSMAQVGLLLDTQIASFFITGSVTWLYYADRLVEFPLGIFSIALATVILPGLSAHHVRRSAQEFSATLDWSLRLTVALVSPAAVGLLVFAGPIIATVFGHGKFNDLRDVQMAAWALVAYALGLMGFSLVKVLAPGYFARQDTRTPMRYGVLALIANVALNLAVALPAAWLGFRAPHVLLAASTCLASTLNAVLLWRGLVRAGVYRAGPGWSVFLLRVLLANALMALLLWWLGHDLSAWLALGGGARVLRCAGSVLAGAALYFAVLFAVGTRYNQPLGTDSPT
ncbi:MAG TPA: murein biosynthesis integral membrane protein MurJ [Steroidobacteraceae bacterium]|nr:murein biosynthesis integral membrane protein MurJ [Steroidobacteraceae bacterium]